MMAFCAVRSVKELEIGRILAPERYDPRREALKPVQNSAHLGDLVRTSRIIVNGRSGLERILILDTSDAREGVVATNKKVVSPSEIGSAKKLIPANSVIISRLRPYLRQVAFVDAHLWHSDPSLSIAGSTEFFVLESLTKASIAFLVPFLLAEPVQSVLNAAQEGGHHPRFDEGTLLRLPMPTSFLEHRGRISAHIEKAIEFYRRSEEGVNSSIKEVEKCFGNSTG